MRRVLKIFWIIIVAIAILLFAVMIVMQTPAVQTFVARKVERLMEENINGTISFSKIHFKPFNALVIKDLFIVDNQPVHFGEVELDTLFHAESVITTFSLKGLWKREGLHFNRASVTNASLLLTGKGKSNNLKRIFNLGGRPKKKQEGDLFDIGRIQIADFRFRLVKSRSDSLTVPYGLNWRDLDVQVDRLDGRDLKFSDGCLSGILHKAVLREKSGYSVSHLSGKAKVGRGTALIEDIQLTDAWSQLDLPSFTMSYDDATAFKDFLHRVRMNGVVNRSRIDFRTLAYFAPALRGKSVALDVKKADVEGTVSDLGINRLEFSEAASGISGALEGRLSGLPDVSALNLDVQAENFDFTSEGVGKLLAGLSLTSKIDLTKFAIGNRFRFDGHANGPINHMKVLGEVDSDAGNLTADLDVRNLVDPRHPIHLDGRLTTRDLNLGQIAGVKQIGPCTLRSTLHADFGPEGPEVTIDTVFIDKLHALDYTYSNIVAAGTYSQNAFDGRIICNDPNLNFIFQGIFTLSDKSRNGLYKFYANIGYADLQALNLDKRGVSKVSGQVDANYMSVGRGDILGDLNILNLQLENEQGNRQIGNIHIASHSNEDIHRINLSSRFLDGTYVGGKSLPNAIRSVKELTIGRELTVLTKDTTANWKGENYDLDLKFHDSRDLLSFVIPGLYIADGTAVKLNVSGAGTVQTTVKSPRLAMGRNYLKDLNLNFNNNDGSLNGAVSSSEMRVASMEFLNNSYILYADENRIGLGYTYDNESLLSDKGEIYLTGELERDPLGKLILRGRTLPSSIYYNGEGWRISPASVKLHGSDFSIDNLQAACNDQSIRIRGGYSKERADTLSLDLVRFDLGILNRMLQPGFDLEGLATGHATVLSPDGQRGLLMSLTCDSVKVAGHPLGTLSLTSSWEDGEDKFHFTAFNNLQGSNTLALTGDFFTRTKAIDAVVDLNGMNVGYVSPVLSTIFSEMGGGASGRIRVQGPFKNLSLSSENARFDNVLLKVGFTNVPYYVTGPFHVNNNGLYFDSMAIKDNYDGTGTISGGVLFNRLKDFRMDTRISMNRMEALDTRAEDSPSFYGHVFASGNVSLTGPFNAILLDINARTMKQGTLHIPLDNTSDAGTSDLLTFKEYEQEAEIDPYDLLMQNMVATGARKSDLGVRLRLNCSPDVEAFVEVDRTYGNYLSGRGRGIIDLMIRPGSDLFTINGDYTLSEGSFHFNAMNIAKRDFTLTDGSSIRFNGDIMDSDLDLQGQYTTKASVATLIADTSSFSSRRIVNCGIDISGRLREPRLGFSIEVPDLDPTTHSRVQTALNTEDKIQRQFFSLLITNSFLPDEQSGVVNNTNMLYSNVAEIMAGQLNNILQKLDIPLDLGLNYQASESGTNIFDVALSTQLFNNRVIVNGTVGNREYGNSGAEGDMVGDLDIEIKLDRPGQLRLSLFSHSADDYTNFLDNTQRNGVGITYQREFNTFGEFFRNLFISRKKREELQLQAEIKKDKKTIAIHD